MVTLDLHSHDRCGERTRAEHPHDQNGRQQIQRKPERLQDDRNVRRVAAAVQPRRDQPEQRDRDKRQHEHLAGWPALNVGRMRSASRAGAFLASHHPQAGPMIALVIRNTQADGQCNVPAAANSTAPGAAR